MTTDWRARGMAIAETWLDQIRYLSITPDHETAERIRRDVFWDRPCPDCAAELGQAHEDGCDVARCLWSGDQRLGCSGMTDWEPCECEDELDEDDVEDVLYAWQLHHCGQTLHDCGTELWDGVWPGTGDAVNLGVYSETFSHAPCGPEHPKATPDLNAVCWLTTWDRATQRRVPVPNARRAARERIGAYAKVIDSGGRGTLFVPWPPDDAPAAHPRR